MNLFLGRRYVNSIDVVMRVQIYNIEGKKKEGG